MDRTATPTRRPAWPVGAVVFTLAVAGAFAWYAVDVSLKARGPTDWMMIVPAAAIGIIALLVCIVEDIRAHRAVPAPDDEVPAAGDETHPLRSIAFMALLAAYVAAIPWTGFDVGTFLFLAAALVVQGERSWWRCLLFASLVTVPVVYVFVHLLQVRLATLIL